MGAVPYDGGVMFRVWSPFARGIAVAGSFNGWHQSRQAEETVDGVGIAR